MSQPRLPNSRFKEDLPKSKRQREKEAQAQKTKGSTLEKEVAQKLGGKRNHQHGKPYGGTSNPDVSAMYDWSFEVKNTERLELHKWLKNLKEETPSNKKPGLVFSVENEPWITIRLADRVSFAADLIEAAGFEVVPR